MCDKKATKQAKMYHTAQYIKIVGELTDLVFWFLEIFFPPLVCNRLITPHTDMK